MEFIRKHVLMAGDWPERIIYWLMYLVCAMMTVAIWHYDVFSSYRVNTVVIVIVWGLGLLALKLDRHRAKKYPPPPGD